ncbi:MAG: hypothetical protein HQK50_10220 [Oligoflexia bacterium]|nr:hypothetical protein [Oligoflexia bacterium]
MGRPVNYSEWVSERQHFAALSIRVRTQQVAHKCYREVGKGMVITPSSLLILILLNEPSGPLTISSIVDRAKPIVNYCEKFDIPLAASLRFGDLESALRNVMAIFLENGKLKEIRNQKLDQTFYTVEPDARIELLYSKNTILHHFLVPFFIHSIWINVFNGAIKTPEELREFLQERLEELKYELHLPTINELFYQSVDIVADCIGRRLRNIDDCFSLTPAEMYSIALRVAPFVNAFRHIYEGHYIAAITLRYLKNNSFDSEQFLKVSKEHFELERTHGRFIRYSESYAVPTIKNILGHFVSVGLVRPVSSAAVAAGAAGEEEREELAPVEIEVRKSNLYYVPSQRKVEEVITRYAKELTEALILNLRGPDIL